MIRVKPKTQHRIRLAPRRVRHMIHTKSCHLHYKQKESRPFWREWDHFTWPNMGMRGCQVSFYDLVLTELKLFYTPHWFPCDCEAPACWRSNFVETPQLKNEVHDLITGAKIVVNRYLLLEILSFFSTQEDGATRKHHALIQNVPKTSCTTSLFDFKLKKAASFFLFFLKGVVNNNQHNLCSSWITSS